MPEDVTHEVGLLLQEATAKAEALQGRLEAGEAVPEEEMARVAREVAETIETANQKLRELVGPIDSALLREKMVEDMTPEEFEQWSEDNAALQAYRAEKTQEDRRG